MKFTGLFFIACCLLGLLAGSAQTALAQNRNLPKANFQTFTQPAGSNLPATSGLYLRPGENRGKNNQAQPYDPTQDQLGLVRWERNKMPLHVWIAPGLKLPDVPFSELPSTRVNLVRDMLQALHPFSELEQTPGWAENFNSIAAAGFEEWRQFETEGLVSFDFTDDPKMAHILVFWTDGFKDADAPGGVYVQALTCSQQLPVDKARELEAAGRKIVPVGYVVPGRGDIIQNPVVIELGVGSEFRLHGAAAHEFGHALGIIKHSPYREDLMYVDRVVDELSPGDKETFRRLYHASPQGVF